MPHNLFSDQLSGQTAMMYVGASPWHGLGNKLDNPPTSDEAIKAAGLDWKVEKYPLEAITPHGRVRLADNFVIMREDYWKNNKTSYFAVVSEGYEVLQNREAFRFFDEIVGKKEAIYETAGALGDGERIWILAKLPDTIKVVGEDVCDKYLLLSNSHDGKSSVQVKFTPIRVVCQNTLTMALNQGPTIRVAHTHNMRERLHKSEELLGIIRERFNAIGQDFQRMANVQMDSKKVSEYYKIIFPDPADPQEKQTLKKVENIRREAEEYFSSGQGNQGKGTAGTLWAAYNGITEMVDYPKTTRKEEEHLSSIWFGDGYHLKAKAFKIAMENIKTWAG